MPCSTMAMRICCNDAEPPVLGRSRPEDSTKSTPRWKLIWKVLVLCIFLVSTTAKPQKNMTTSMPIAIPELTQMLCEWQFLNSDWLEVENPSSESKMSSLMTSKIPMNPTAIPFSCSLLSLTPFWRQSARFTNRAPLACMMWTTGKGRQNWARAVMIPCTHMVPFLLLRLPSETLEGRKSRSNPLKRHTAMLTMVTVKPLTMPVSNGLKSCSLGQMNANTHIILCINTIRQAISSMEPHLDRVCPTADCLRLSRMLYRSPSSSGKVCGIIFKLNKLSLFNISTKHILKIWLFTIFNYFIYAMQFNSIAFLPCFLITLVRTWSAFSAFSDELQQQFGELQNYSVNYKSFSSKSQIFIFGGTLAGVIQSDMIYADLIEGVSSVVEVQGSQKPEGRFGHCSILIMNDLYIFGGFRENGSLTDLWRFNTQIFTWTPLLSQTSQSTQGPVLSDCSLTQPNNNQILAWGRNTDSDLEIHSIKLDTLQWTQLQYSHTVATVETGTLWDKSTWQTSAPVLTHSLRVDSICVVASSQTNVVYLVSQNKLYVVSMLPEISLEVVREVSAGLECLVTSEWILLVTSFKQTQLIAVEYISELDHSVGGVMSLKYPQSGHVGSFLIGDDIGIVAGLGFYLLSRWCSGANNPHVEMCFYGVTKCIDGKTGPDCSLQSCPNSLVLFDAISMELILVECSDHGECTAQGCQCEQDWAGEDCSRYLRKECLQGQNVENWPVNNCECDNETQGGNNCEITFCYNDCSGNGKCNNSGDCQCQSGYYGADCSISIIGFPSASYSL